MDDHSASGRGVCGFRPLDSIVGYAVSRRLLAPGPRAEAAGLLGRVLGLVLYYGAYEAEICRSGILAIDKGQIEAAVALGMRPIQVLRRITLPQALRVALPPTGSLFIGTLKGSAQVAVVALARNCCVQARTWPSRAAAS